MRILLLEDDRSLREGIGFKLMREGYAVESAASVGEALGLLSGAFDLAILDVGLPDGSGLSVCKAIRAKHPQTHILFLTAQDAELDIVLGYESGGDDYVVKPFSLSVLMSKIAAIARRSEARSDAQCTGEIRLDTERQCALVRERRVELSRNEWRLMRKFMAHAGQVLTKEQLLSALWDVDGDFVDENTLAVNIRRLREKIEDDPSHPARILNVRGVGYRFAGDGHEA